VIAASQLPLTGMYLYGLLALAICLVLYLNRQRIWRGGADLAATNSAEP
jgi:hypothetical protein